jgi:hypothetical protein
VSHGIHLLWSGDQHVIAGPIEQGSRDNGPLKRRYQHNPFVAVQGFHLQKVYTGASDTNHCTWSIHWHLSRCNHHLAVSQGVSRDLRPIATQVVAIRWVGCGWSAASYAIAIVFQQPTGFLLFWLMERWHESLRLCIWCGDSLMGIKHKCASSPGTFGRHLVF